MDLEQLGASWEQFGTDDPLWAVLTGAEKRHRGWDEDEFFATADHELGIVSRWLDTALPGTWRSLPRGRALDFGCGVGRLTLWLGERFDRCDGVDIAESMVQRARQYAEGRPGGRSCTYHRNDRPDLALFADDTFDLIYTAHVLQHMEPGFARAYVKEFVRVLRPHGLAVFQLPVGPAPPPVALPAAAFAATSRTEAQAVRADPGEVVEVVTETRNCGTHTWPAFSTSGSHHVEVWHRWTRVGADERVGDPFEPTSLLGQDIGPEGTVELRVRTPAPTRPGRWDLQLGLVQVGVDPFTVHPCAPSPPTGAKGSVPGPLRVRGRLARKVSPHLGVAHRRLDRWLGRQATPGEAVPATAPEEPPRDGPAAAEAEGEPIMEMHATPAAEVQRWVEEAGGQVVAQADWCALFDQRPTDWSRGLFVVTSGPA